MQRILRTIVVIAFASLVPAAQADWQQRPDPPDQNKPGIPPGPPTYSPDNTCWLASAANMLAAAGYGDGANADARASDVYGELIAHYTRANGGFPDRALEWWLGSSHNHWPTNLYTIVTDYGPISLGWHEPDGLGMLANELREGDMVSLAIRNLAVSGAHAVTMWGDSGTAGLYGAGENPASILITDSDLGDGTSSYPVSWNSMKQRWELPYNGRDWYVYYAATLERTPEPGTLGLLLVCGLALLRRRRN